MTSAELVHATITFKTPNRFAHDFPDPHGSDFAGMGMTPSVDARPWGDFQEETDAWGARWRNIGVCKLGEVFEFPLQDWADFDALTIPDVRAPERWETLDAQREAAGDRFIIAHGTSIYERVHFIRGLENTWTDIYEYPEELGRLIDILVEMNLYAIERFATAGAHGFMWCDDWGLQDRLMIPPDKWREIWKPRYARIYEAAHAAGLRTFLHSCGHIVDILDDLIEIGLDVIHMDQQENMGLELLGKRFGGRLTFYAPVDIQHTMCTNDLGAIRAYCGEMVRHLARPTGGFLPRWYSDPDGAGHTRKAIDAMCTKFLRLGADLPASVGDRWDAYR